jgi:hypothetical protein
VYHVPELIEEREMEDLLVKDLLERLVEKQVEIDTLKIEKREMVNVKELVTELLKEINWDQKLGGANEHGSVAQQQETGMFHAIRTIADVSGKDFKIDVKEVTKTIGIAGGGSQKTFKEFSFDDTLPMLEPKF